MFYIDHDHFKDVNDTLGHPVGDELIRNVTLRLSPTLHGDDLVARLGGDEFAVISSIGDDSGKMMAVVQRIIAAICAPYMINWQNIVIGASIVIAVIDRKCGGAADIMRYADMALYRAKNEGRNRACIYDAAMDVDLSNRKLLEGDLRFDADHGLTALVDDRLVQQFQVIILDRLALCRWTQPDPGRNSAQRIHRRRRAQRIDHRSRQLGAAPRLPRRQGLAGPHRLGQRVAAAIPSHRFLRRRATHLERNRVRPGPA